MNKMYVGLDLGTSSVGWAVTDEDYNLIELNNKTAWGSRIFSEAHSSQDRRLHRSARRRLARRKYRLNMLEELFAEEISKIDDTFFLRLKYSTLHFDDKSNNVDTRNLIFKTKEEEINYYKQYPTIWHLRKALCNGDKDALSDIKKVFLALHHIIKYRGNFIKDGEYETKTFDDEVIVDINTHLKSKFEDIDKDFITCDKKKKLIDILSDSNLNKAKKRTEIKKLFEIDPSSDDIKELVDLFAALVSGGEKKIDDTKYTLISSFEENQLDYNNNLGDDYILVEKAKIIYDFIQVKNLLGEKSELSAAMVEIYDNHKKDLQSLKQITKKIDSSCGLVKSDSTYNKIFRFSNKDKKEESGYYSILVGVNSIAKKRGSLEDFNTNILKILNDNKNNYKGNQKIFDRIHDLAESKQLLKIPAHLSTSSIPHQLHLKELEKILNQSIKYHPFIEDIKEDILLLFKFRVPYYCGPLNNSSYSNIVKYEGYENEKVTRCNFDKIVDKNKTKNKFINKLLNNCTYIYGEKVLPKASLYFEEYLIYNKLNTLLVNGDNLSPKDKKNIFNHIVEVGKLTQEKLKKYLSSKYGLDEKDIILSNIKEGDFFEAKSHHHLYKTFDIVNDKKNIEEYIKLATVYNDNKKELKTELNYLKSLNEEQVKVLLNLPTSKWAPFSKELLINTEYNNHDTGESISILDALHETNCNFESLLYHEKYRFIDIIEEKNRINKEETDEKQIEKLLESTPALFRRSINQTLLILDDITRASKKQIDKIIIEVTRKDELNKNKKETNPRYKELKAFLSNLYNECNELKNSHVSSSDIENLQDELDSLDQIKLKGKHIYLYFKQLGMDMYTGKHISLDDVINGVKYDTDHIIPQKLIKDDSLDNLVLVDKDYNQKIKKDEYPIPESIKTKEVLNLWDFLKNKNLITEKKYASLTRRTRLSEEELREFVNRQINAINYSNIVLRNILEIKYPNTEIIFSKAQYPSFIRKELLIVKNRDVNDTHHAIDAYLNIFTGNILNTTFKKFREIYKDIYNDREKTFNMENVLSYYLKSKDKNGVTYQKKIYQNSTEKHDILVTYKLDYINGRLYKGTIYKHSPIENLIPIHSNGPMKDVSRYGGYSDLAHSHLLFIEYKKKDKIAKTINRVSLMESLKNKDNKTIAKNILGCDNSDIIRVIKINQNQKIKYNNGIYLIYTNDSDRNKYKLVYQNYIDNVDLLYIDQANRFIDNNTLLNDDIVGISISDKKYKKYKSILFPYLKEKNDEYFIDINKENNLIILNNMLDNIRNLNKEKGIYNSCNYINSILNLNIDEFESLSIKNQILIINIILKALSRNGEDASILIKALKDQPENRIPKFDSTLYLRKSCNLVPEKDHISIVRESPSGLFSREVEL